MRRMWISLVVLLWLGTYVVGAEQRTRGLRQSPRTAAAAAAEKATDATAAAPAPEGESAKQSSATAGGARRTVRAAGGAISVVAAGEGDRRHTRAVLRLKAVPATDTANTIVEFLRAEAQAVPTDSVRNAVIVPDPMSNSLIVGGPPEAVSEVEKLVAELDRPAPMVRLEVILGEVPVEKAGQDAAKAPSPEELRAKMDILAQVQLTTLDNQAAQVHLGRREAKITSTQITQLGQVSSVSYENLGTIMKLTPRVSPDGMVSMELEVEDSRLGPPEESVTIAVPKEGQPTRAPKTETLMVRTSLSIADGQTVAVGGTDRPAKSGKQRWVLVTPHVVPPGKAK